MPIRVDESREMDSASRRTFSKLGGAINDTLTVSSPNRKNLIDNAAIKICQRSTNITGVTASTFASDRWQFGVSAMGTWTLQQVTDGPANTEFKTCFTATVTTADASPAAGDLIEIQQGV